MVANPFDQSTLLDTSQLGLDAVIPPNTHILCDVYGQPGKDKDAPDTQRILVKGSIPAGARPTDDYTLVPTTPTVFYVITVVLTTTFIDRLQEKREPYRQAIGKILGKTVELDVSGMTVKRHAKGDKCMEAQLEGSGQRVMRVVSKNHIIRFFDFDREITPSVSVTGRGYAPSPTPSWFGGSPADSSSVAGPSRPQPANGAPNGLRPLSAMPRPAFDVSKAAHSGRDVEDDSTMKKRSSSPDRRLDVGAKRARNEPVPPFPRHNGFASRRDLRQVEVTPAASTTGTADEPPTEAIVDVAESKPIVPEVVEQDTAGHTPRSDAPPVEARSTNRGPWSRAAQDVLKAAFGGKREGRDLGIDTTPARTAVSPVKQMSSGARSSDVFRPKGEREASLLATPSSETPVKRPTDPHSSPLTPFEAAKRKRAAEAEAARAREEAGKRESEALVGDLSRPIVLGNRQYRPLTQLDKNCTANIMGIVCDHPNMREAFGSTDCRYSIVLVDPATVTAGLESEGTVVTIMRPKQDQMPKFYKGQAVLVRDTRISEWNGKLKANVYSRGSPMASFAGLAGRRKVKKMDETMEVHQEEIERLEALATWWKGHQAGNSGEPGVAYIDDQSTMTQMGAKRGEITLDQVVPGTFFDGTFKIVVAVHNPMREPHHEIYVTDGTTHARRTNNFHGVECGIPPSSIFCLAIFDEQPEHVKRMLVSGSFMHMKNVNVKENKTSGALELKWAEKMTHDQVAMGWRNKKLLAVEAEDHRATEINRRINELKRQMSGGASKGPTTTAKTVSTPATPSVSTKPPSAIASAPAPGPSPYDEPEEEARLATTISTRHKDVTSAPIMTIKDIRENAFFPNRFRFRARVKAIFPRRPAAVENEPSLVCYYCKGCVKTYVPSANNLCSFCKNPAADIEVRYRFIVHLEDSKDKDTDMFVLIDGAEGEGFLPPLPPIRHSDNPNDAKKQEVTLAENRTKVEEVLLGNRMNGKRTRPIIDWTVETYVAQSKDRKTRVAAVRVFGMQR